MRALQGWSKEENRMVQGRKPNRRIEIHSPEPAEELPENGFDEGSGDEQAISLEDLGDAYAAVLQMHQSIEPYASELDEETERENVSAVIADGSEGSLPMQLGKSKVQSSDFDGVETVDPVNKEVPGSSANDRNQTSGGVGRTEDADVVPVSLVSILESICFVGTRDGKPIPLSFLAQALRDFSETEIRAGIDSLNQQLRSNNSAMVVDTVGDGFKIALAPDLVGVAEGISGPTKESQLTQAAIDCLSLIAYQPGVTKDEIEKQWGQPAGGILANLSKKGLIKTDSDPTGSSQGSEDTASDLTSESFALSAHSPPKTRPRYFTTDRFLEILGLQSLDDLPRGDEL
jgi:chromosome segregation and condensation protein ScpB